MRRLARALGTTRVDGIRATSRRGTASTTRETARRRADDDDDGTTRFFEFRVIHESARSRARVGEIRTARGVVRTPGYVPVGTNAVIKAVHGSVLDDAGIDLMFANAYHLMIQPGAEVVKALGGVHEMMGRRRPVITDSGGFQVFSLDAGGGSSGKELKSRNATRHKRQSLLLGVSEEGATFRSYRDGTKMTLTPESSVAAQKAIGADIIIPLDELPPYDVSGERLRDSVERSHRWMERSLREHLRDVRRQAMYGVVHGGVDKELRRMSVEFLAGLPFDGMAIGGSLGRDSAELDDLLRYLMPLLPRDRPNHLLGIGDVGNIDRAVALGVDTFDSCYPTQVARHGTLFTRSRGRVNFRRAEYRTSLEPACEECACTLCTKHSLGYLHHLDRAREPLAWSLASEHNLFHVGDKMARLRERILHDDV